MADQGDKTVPSLILTTSYLFSLYIIIEHALTVARVDAGIRAVAILPTASVFIIATTIVMLMTVIVWWWAAHFNLFFGVVHFLCFNNLRFKRSEHGCLHVACFVCISLCYFFLFKWWKSQFRRNFRSFRWIVWVNCWELSVSWKVGWRWRRRMFSATRLGGGVKLCNCAVIWALRSWIDARRRWPSG